MEQKLWSDRQSEQWHIKVGLAEMLKGGVIMDVTNAAQAKLAEKAGACAVMALERVPADIRAQGGVARMSDPKIIKEIQDAVSIPVMAKCRIGHFVEAQILEALGIDFIDESEVLTPADDRYHVYKHPFKVPFVCGCRDLGEALRRIGEGAAMIRTKGEAGTGDIIEAVRHMRTVMDGIARLLGLPEEELMTEAKELGAPFELVWEVAKTGKLPVPNFSAGGVATPADAALMMQLGAESVFVGSGIFKSSNPERRAKAIVSAVVNYKDPKILAEISEDLGEPMVGIGLDELIENQKISGEGLVSSHRIGLLALQGDYEAHGKALVRAGFPRCDMVEIRSFSDLQFLTAIIIPGGESTVMSMLLERFGMFEELKRQIENGMPVLATCAGLILLAKNIEGNDQMGLGVLDIKVKRNAYGRQVDSFHAPVQTIIDSVGIIEGIFIRAPRILASGKEVEHLAIYENEPVMVRQGSIIAATFHPELLPDAPVHRWFIQTFV